MADDHQTIASLLQTIWLIRVASGVEDKTMLGELPAEIMALREERDELRLVYSGACHDREKIRTERDRAVMRLHSILNEIDCRVEHGADSNGHLEAIRALFSKTVTEPSKRVSGGSNVQKR